MADAWIIATDSLDNTERKLLLKDNRDSSPVTYSLGVQQINTLVPDAYDYISLSYTGSNLTGVVFKTGGSGGTTVATLTLAYTGSVLDSVTKT